ncbi:hypothetical protein DXI23_17320 [Marinobacter flavimaris]|uniref:Thioredoxin family protein n=1 Tax=Marinobacter flavimaris TaxID=262076 RepID=A0A3D8GZE5_9GAMM|nr:hypothetical protein [Marinobacter flavimaris]PPI78978.1 hypothetical protein MDHKLMBL_17880 [Marinobacter flavimaris]RDU39772.1 hypothetical protein DXI23_17320 [Marinobacter flavimaris]
MKSSLVSLLRISAALFLLGVAAGTANAETARSMLDGDVFAAEANHVELVSNASGEVVQVRVEGCESCVKSSYLPARDLVISRQGKAIDVRGASGLVGNSATLVIGVGSELVEQVDFWVPRGDGGDQ